MAGRLVGTNYVTPDIIARGYDVLPDGRFITLLPADNTSNGRAASEMRIVLNWFEELKRLVPTK